MSPRFYQWLICTLPQGPGPLTSSLIRSIIIVKFTIHVYDKFVSCDTSYLSIHVTEPGSRQPLLKMPSFFIMGNDCEVHWLVEAPFCTLSHRLTSLMVLNFCQTEFESQRTTIWFDNCKRTASINEHTVNSSRVHGVAEKAWLVGLTDGFE